MTAHVTIEGFKDSITDWKGRPIAAIGDKVTLIVKLWDYQNLKGGRFRVRHSGLGASTPEFDVPARRATGWKGLKTTPQDLAHEDTIECEVTLSAVNAVPEFFVLEAVTNCTTVDNSEEKLRVYADADARDARRIVVRSGYDTRANKRYQVAKAGNSGLPATIGNTVRTHVAFFAELHFKDPDGDERPFPKDTPVKVVLGDEPRHAIDTAVGDDGTIDVEFIGHADAIAGKKLTLRFGSDTDNQVVCELPGASKSQVKGPVPPAGDATGTIPARMFTWPRNWSLRQSDWAVTQDGGRWKADEGAFETTVSGRAASLGKRDARVKLVLDPHWQFVRFDHFDRRYGRSDHGGAAKSMPAVMLEGFRYKPSSATSKPDVRSNWYVEQGGEVVQCVPWVIQRKDDGTARKRPSRHTLLRFELPAKTCIHAESATTRKRVVATTAQLEPGPARLDFYDLPEKWNSRNYYAKLSTTAGEFGWYEDVAGKATTKTKPLVFSLDDIVLTDENGRRLKTWNHTDRLAIFAHTFDDTLGNATKEGLHKPDAGNKKPWLTEAPTAGAPEENENYVVDFPKWTRLISAKGNLFDVFDKRTVESSPADPDYDVVGARAAVRWVDTTARIGATTVGDFSGTNGAWAWSTTNAPKPGMKFFPGRPDRTKKDHFTIQPYFAQDYMQRFGKYKVAGNANDFSDIGRFDMTLVRCCGRASVDGVDTELAVNLYFHKMFFDFAIAIQGGISNEDFQVRFARSVMDRYNGLDAKNSQGRAEILPVDATATPLKTTVVHFIQMSPEAEAHFKIKLVDGTKGGRDFRGSDGGGETSNRQPEEYSNTNGFINAHEHGHQSALPDEYNERWSAASYGQPSFYSTLPGDPYELDGRTVEFQEMGSPMMNGNHTLHNRYFWQSAEWVRQVVGASMKVKLGGTYKDYKLPPYATANEAKRHYAYWPISSEKYDVTIPGTGALASNRGKLDMFLYAIGADKFALKTLPDRESPAGSDPYDGILMVTVRCHVKAWGVKRGDEDDLKQLVQGLGLAVRRDGKRKLNHVWHLTGEANRGAREAWTFKRCLVHFSPRFVVSGVTELESVTDWDNRLGEFKNETVWTTVKAKLQAYHDKTWEDGDKLAKLTALVGPEAQPTITVKGAWNLALPAVSAVNTKLTSYESKPVTPYKARVDAAKALVDACDLWLSQPSNATHPNRGDVTALRGRAEAGRLTLGAMKHVRDLEEAAKKLKERNKEQEDLVTKVTTAHPAHFTVKCVEGTPVSASWDPLPVQGDLPEAATWASGLPTRPQFQSIVDKAKGLITKYRSKAKLDLKGRIDALTELVGPVAVPASGAPRGTWADGAKPGLLALKTSLEVAEAVGADDFDARASAYETTRTVADGVSKGTDTTLQKADHDAAGALRDRLALAADVMRLMKKVREIEAHAKVFKEHLERWVASRTVTLTANSKAGFEQAMLEAFPSMIGAYKSSEEIAEDDLRAFLTQLGLADLKVVDMAPSDDEVESTLWD